MKLNYCESCNEELDKHIKFCTICKNLTYNKNLFNKLNIKNSNLKVANNNAIKILSTLYFDEKLSSIELFQKLKIRPNTLYNFFKKNKLKLRNNSESTSLAIFNENLKLPSNYKYKEGYHKTWYGEKVFLRSSYEFKYAKELDKNKVNYKVESLRIKYFDSQRKIERIAIPDFYLINENKIVEIKSSYTLDKINMQDKINAYTKLGYNFDLIVNFKNVTL